MLQLHLPNKLINLTVWNTSKCNFNCKYCLPKGTRILMADFTWKPIEEIKEGEYVIGVNKDSKYKHLGLVKSKVIAVVSRKDLIYRVTTDRGVIYLTDNHPILSRYSRWLAINPKRADVKSYTLKVGHKLRHFVTPLDTLNNFNEDYMKGYLCAVFIGDGCYTEYHYLANPDKPYLIKYGYTKPVKRVTRYLRLAVKDEPIINRVKSFLEKLRLEYSVGEHKYEYKGSIKTLPKITIYKKEIINSILNPSYDDEESFLKGFVAGLFDAEGSFTGILRISNKNLEVLNKLKSALEFFGFTVKILIAKDSIYELRVSSSFNDIVRFINLFRPAVTRKFGKVMKIRPKGFASVLKIEPLGETEVFNIQTETENYIAEGFIVHNCFVYRLYDVIGQEMDSDTINALLDFAYKHLDPKGGIWFFGGEPLVSFENMKLITEKAMANRIASNFGATTNLYLLDEDKIRWMAKRNIKILASLDGTAEIHDRHRVLKDGSPTWQRCWNNLKNYIEITGNTPEIRWTIQTTDIEALEKTPEAMRFLIDKGFTSMAMDFVYEVDVDEDILKAIEKMMIETVKILDAYYSQGKYIHTMMVRDAYTALTTYPRTGYIRRCGLGQGDVGIAPNGKIFGCHRFVSSASEDLCIGTLWEGFNPKRLEINEKWAKYPPYSEKPELCLTCRFKNACMGGCIAANYDVFGDPHIIPKTMCLIKNINVSVFEPLIRKHETFIAKHMHPTGRECVE